MEVVLLSEGCGSGLASFCFDLGRGGASSAAVLDVAVRLPDNSFRLQGVEVVNRRTAGRRGIALLQPLSFTTRRANLRERWRI